MPMCLRIPARNSSNAASLKRPRRAWTRAAARRADHDRR
jgi:hypothetical protein